MSESVSLYGGKYLLEFDKAAHAYRVNGQPVDANVTKVTEVISGGGKTAALMGWACKEMAAYLEGNWPKTHYGAYLELVESEFQALIKKAKAAHKQRKKDAASVGGQAHDWIDAHIKAQLGQGFEPLFQFTDSRVESAVMAYLDFERSRKVRYLESERKVYSPTHGYVGTLDRLVEVDGVVGIEDLKTSNGWRSEYSVQIAAYEMAYMEEFPGVQINRRIGVMLSKDDAKFEVIELPLERRDADFKAFLGALDVFRWSKSIVK